MRGQRAGQPDSGFEPDGAPRRAAAGAPLAGAGVVVAFGGLFAAGVLSAGHLMDLPVPCGRGHGCAALAAGPASTIAGTPVAYFGVVAYGVIIPLLLFSPRRSAARWALAGISGAGAALSAALLYYASFVARMICPWCIASGVAMGVLAAISVGIVWRGQGIRACPTRLAWALAFLTAAALGVQAGLMQRRSLAPPIAAERLAAADAASLVDPAKALGPSDAPVTIVMFADLYCPGCRATEPALVRFQRANPQAVRLAFRHWPLAESSAAGAALSEIAAEHGRFWDFVGAVYAGGVPPLREAWLRLMEELGCDAAQAEARVADGGDPAVGRVYRDRDLGDALGLRSVPAFIVLLEDQPPVAASQRTLQRILNSPCVVGVLAGRRAAALGGSAATSPD